MARPIIYQVIFLWIPESCGEALTRPGNRTCAGDLLTGLPARSGHWTLPPRDAENLIEAR